MGDYESLSHTKWDDLDPTEICGFAGGRFHQGQERDPLGADVRTEEAQLRRTEFLGQRVLVSTEGRDEAAIREYQEQEDKRLDQLNLWR